MIKHKKFLVIFVLTCLVLEILVMIPTFSKLKSENNEISISEWDKTIADSFHDGDGSINNPYIISNAKELAYFSKQLETNDFNDIYIKLSNDIILNKGFFKYDKEALYINDDQTYYLNIDTSKYYLEPTYETEKGSINEFMNLDGFKGHFDGDFHTIYGLYLKGENISLFTNFSGELTNLFIENAYINGKYEASGVVLDATNANISNVVFNGNVVSSNEIKDNTITNKLDDISITGEYKLDLNLPLVTSKDYTFTLSGKYENTNQVFTINGNQVTGGEFSLELNPYDITINSTDTILLTDLEYTLTYTTNLSSAIISRALNSNITGIVNRGNVIGTNVSGLIGINYNSNISNSYNIGNLSGENLSSIINTVLLKDIKLENVYSNNDSALIYNAVNSKISLNNSFNTNKVKAITNNYFSNIAVNNSYNIEEIYYQLDLNNIQYIYKEYDKDKIEEGNIWVYDELPLLYFDDLNNKYVNIKIGNNTWNSYHQDLKNLSFSNDISVILTSKEEYKPIKQVYYYISDNPLTKEELNLLEWKNEYNGTITLSKEASYIIYVKVIDYNAKYYYLNTDKLNLSLNDYHASINTDNLSWEKYHNPKKVYITNNVDYSIMAIDKINGIKSINYIISDKVLSTNELDSIEEWNTYEKKFNVELSDYIIYAKVISNDSKVTYLNSDRMINKGYQITNIKSGNNTVFNSNMTYDSSFNFNISLNHENIDSNNLNRYIKTNNKLPEGTLIILKDLESKKVYQYTSNDTIKYNESLSSYLYPLDSFKEIGKMTFITYFDNNNYNDSLNESYNINIIFSDIKPVDENLEISLIAYNSDITINTINPISINLYDTDTNINNYLNIKSTNTAKVIYNTLDTKTIPINVSLNNLIKNDINILNTNYENMHYGIAIEVVDKDNKVLESSYYKGIKFGYDNQIYTPSNNKTLIELDEYNKDILLDIITNIDNTSSLVGTYYFKITSYLSIDGKIKEYESKNYVSIPLEFNKDYTKINYSFDVSLLNGNIINQDNNQIISFNILERGNLTNPNVRISLYKKKILTAYNQEYVKVDLKDYVINNLEDSGNLSYFALNNVKENDINNFSITLKDNIEINGYMFNFELYDGNNLIGEVNRKVVVR